MTLPYGQAEIVALTLSSALLRLRRCPDRSWHWPPADPLREFLRSSQRSGVRLALRDVVMLGRFVQPGRTPSSLSYSRRSRSASRLAAETYHHADFPPTMSSPAPAAAVSPEPIDATRGFQRYHGVFVFLLGLGVRLWFIHAYPVVFGGDSIMRLANHDRILLAYQLPLLQLGVHYISLISENPLWIRYLMALIGASAGLGFYLMTKELLGPSTAFHTALIFVTNPFVLAYSIVPYQEILMLGGLFFGFYFFIQRQLVGCEPVLGPRLLDSVRGLGCMPGVCACVRRQTRYAGSRLPQGIVPFRLGAARLAHLECSHRADRIFFAGYQIEPRASLPLPIPRLDHGPKHRRSFSHTRCRRLLALLETRDASGRAIQDARWFPGLVLDCHSVFRAR